MSNQLSCETPEFFLLAMTILIRRWFSVEFRSKGSTSRNHFLGGISLNYLTDLGTNFQVTF
jgi:hypothetical protein